MDGLSSQINILLWTASISLLLSLVSAGYDSAPYGSKKWYSGTATMYTFNGNSGYCGFPWSFVNKMDYAAVSNDRYDDSKTSGYGRFSGAACGQCYQLRCVRKGIKGSKVFCRGNNVVTIRINDLDATTPNKWGPNNFDMGRSGFSKLADPAAGAINLEFKRVACPNIQAKWTIYPKANPYWRDLGAWDVKDVGSVVEFWIKPTGEKNWIKCQHNWGSHYSLSGKYTVDSRSSVKVILAETKATVFATYSPNQ